MSIHSRPLDPVLLEIMQDLEQRDLDALFVTSPTRLVRGLRDDSALLRPGQAQQSAALRELLRVHREEAAFALFVEAREGLLKRDGTQWTIYPSPDHGTSSREARSPLGAQDFPTDFSSALEIQRILEGRSSNCEEASAASLFAASLRLAPRDSTRINWALALAPRAHHRTAMRVLVEVEESTSSSDMAACAAHDRGFLSWQLGKHRAAFANFTRADRGQDYPCRSAAFAFALSLILDDPSHAITAAPSLAARLDQQPADLVVVEQVLNRIQVETLARTGLTQQAASMIETQPESIARIVQSLFRHEHS